MLRRHLIAAGAAFCAISSFSGTALAWGPEGHAIVADIAEAHLTAPAKAQIVALLVLEGHDHLDQIASWADEVRPRRPETAPWHFVDIPLAAPAYDAGRDCPGENCVVGKIVEFEKILADKAAPAQSRLEALKWVVHFVGDVHQPLHAEDDHDKGGNTVRLSYFGRSTNLHAVWDGGIIEHGFDLHLGPNYSFDHQAVAGDARQLDALISADDRTQWAPAGIDAHLDQAVMAWANEAHALAQTVAYPDLPQDRSGDWSSTYQDETWPVVEGQLERAGVRLAVVLNEALQ